MTNLELLQDKILRMNAGAFGVFSMYLRKIDEVKNSDFYFSTKCSKIDELYIFLNGFVWGMYSMNFITVEERDFAISELIDISHVIPDSLEDYNDMEN